MKLFAALLAISAMPAQADQEQCLQVCRSSYDWCVVQAEDSIEVCSNSLQSCVNRCSSTDESAQPAQPQFLQPTPRKSY